MASPVSPLARIKAGKRDIKLVPWPGQPGAQVGLRLLTAREQADAQVAAIPAQARAGEGAALQALDLYDGEFGIQLLCRAMVVPSTGEAFCASAEEARELLNVAEAAALLDAYNELLESLGVVLDTSSAEAVLQIADELGKAGASGTSSSGSSPTGPKPSSGAPPLTSPTASSSTSSSDPDSTEGRKPPRLRLTTPSSSARGSGRGSR